MDDEFDWDRDEIVDLDGGGCGDATGNPALDIEGYSSPSNRGQNKTGFEPSKIVLDWLAHSRADRERRAAKRRREATEADDRDNVTTTWRRPATNGPASRSSSPCSCLAPVCSSSTRGCC